MSENPGRHRYGYRSDVGWHTRERHYWGAREWRNLAWMVCADESAWGPKGDVPYGATRPTQFKLDSTSTLAEEAAKEAANA